MKNIDELWENDDDLSGFVFSENERAPDYSKIVNKEEGGSLKSGEVVNSVGGIEKIEYDLSDLNDYEEKQISREAMLRRRRFNNI